MQLEATSWIKSSKWCYSWT